MGPAIRETLLLAIEFIDYQLNLPPLSPVKWNKLLKTSPHDKNLLSLQNLINLQCLTHPDNWNKTLDKEVTFFVSYL